ncbi:hypothetical protein TrST_g1141 [Triparma strigata]|uniref:Uncharacterized protein n=1 Tax=Triparma strigata TaxID=1606541 RepID=A0A9W7A650_9STRA|nr:hypothetical protein TrST_g1141 [Triparma strigata]
MGFLPFMFNMIFLNSVLHPLSFAYIFWRKVNYNIPDMPLNEISALIEDVKQIFGEELESADENVRKILDANTLNNMFLKALKVSFYSLSRPGFPLILDDKFVKSRFYDFLDIQFPVPSNFSVIVSEDGSDLTPKYKDLTTGEVKRLRPFNGFSSSDNMEPDLNPAALKSLEKSLNICTLAVSAMKSSDSNNTSNFSQILELVLLNLTLLVDENGKDRSSVKTWNVNIELWFRLLGNFDSEPELTKAQVSDFVSLWHELRSSEINGPKEKKLSSIYSNSENVNATSSEILNKYGSHERGLTREEFKNFARFVELRPPFVADFRVMPILVKYLQLAEERRR